MAASLSNSSLRFSVNFNLVTGYFTFTDLIQNLYTSYYGKTLSNMKGIWKATDPLGAVIYQNAGWTTLSFAAPDVNGATTDWTYTGSAGVGDVPTDSNGDPLTGTYTFEYYLYDGSTTYYISKSYDFQYESPTVEIDLEVNCQTSNLTSTDSTDYVVLDVTPTATRAHLITKPVGSSANAPGSTTDATRTIGGGNTTATILWTRVWTTTITTDLSYSMETWGNYTWLIITDQVTGYDYVDVDCGELCCELMTCITNLYSLYESNKDANPVRAEELKQKLGDVKYNWMLYNMARECGYDSDTYCEAIKTIVDSEDCTCTATVTDTSSQAIWPILEGSGTSSSTGSVWSIGTAVPTGGSAGDGYWQYTGAIGSITDLHLWMNVGGTWTDFGSTMGATGADAEPELTLYSISSDSGTSAGTGEETLHSYTIVGGTIATEDDMVHIVALVQLATNDHGKTLKLYWGGGIVATFFTDSLVDADNNIVRMEAFVTRTGAATQFVETNIQRNGFIKPGLTTGALTLANDIVVKITGQNTIATLNDIVAKHFKVEYIKVVPAP